MRGVSAMQGLAKWARVAVAAVVLPATVVHLASFNVLAEDVSGFVQFLFAMVLVSLLDVFLPHGDSVDVDTPLTVASLYLFGPALAVAMVIASRLVAHFVRNRGSEIWSLASGLLKRVAALFMAAAVLGMFQDGFVGRLGPYAEVLIVAAVFILIQLLVGQLDIAVSRGDSILRTLLGNIAIQSPVLAASASIAVLTVIIHDGMGFWGLVVTVFLIVTMRQSFALLLDVRQAYRVTIESLMGAMEIQSPEDKGLGEKVARLARTAGAELGWFGRRIEHMGYAALLVHYGLSFRRRDSETLELLPTPLADVEFLKPVEPIVSIVRGEVEGTPRRTEVIAAYLVSKAFGYVQGYSLQATERIGQQLDAAALAKANKAFERALAKASTA